MSNHDLIPKLVEITKPFYGNPELTNYEVMWLNFFTLIFVISDVYLVYFLNKKKKPFAWLLIYNGVYIIATQNIYHLIVGEQKEQLVNFAVFTYIGLLIYVAGFVLIFGSDNIIELINPLIWFNVFILGILFVYEPAYPDKNFQDYLFGIYGLFVAYMFGSIVLELEKKI